MTLNVSNNKISLGQDFSVQDFCQKSIKVSDNEEQFEKKYDSKKKMFLHIFVQSHMEEVAKKRLPKENVSLEELQRLTGTFTDPEKIKNQGRLKNQEKEGKRFIALTSDGLKSVQQISKQYNQTVIVCNGLWDLNSQLKTLKEKDYIPHFDQVEIFAHGSINTIRLGHVEPEPDPDPEPIETNQHEGEVFKLEYGYASRKWAQTMSFPKVEKKESYTITYRDYVLGKLDKVMKDKAVLNLRVCWSGRGSASTKESNDSIAKKISKHLQGRMVVGVAGLHTRKTVLSRTLKKEGFYSLEYISHVKEKKMKFKPSTRVFLNGDELKNRKYRSHVQRNEANNTVNNTV